MIRQRLVIIFLSSTSAYCSHYADLPRMKCRINMITATTSTMWISPAVTWKAKKPSR